VLCDLHPIVDVGEYRGPYKVAAVQSLRQLRSVGGTIGPTTDQGGSLPGAPVDVASDLLQVRPADHGADNGRFFQRITNSKPFGALGESAYEIGVEGALNQYPRACRAALAIVGENHE